MLFSQNLLSGKHKCLLGLLLLSFIAIICLAFGSAGSEDYDIMRREVLLRKVGHELLLQSGDSTSRVLPVKKISENEYQIQFENAFTFQPDSLVNTTQRLLAKDPLASDYMVSVINCESSSVVYGFAISKDRKDNIVTCRGRIQPMACYRINVKFKPAAMASGMSLYLLGGLSFLAIAGSILLRKVKPKKVSPDNLPTDSYTLGSVLFDSKNKNLLINNQTIELTGTEIRLLLIFASSPNKTIERSRLQKEIWEDEGVVVGRSLDMFISKLRKKLELDPKINIVVVRGKGYRLEVG